MEKRKGNEKLLVISDITFLGKPSQNNFIHGAVCTLYLRWSAYSLRGRIQGTEEQGSKELRFGE